MGKIKPPKPKAPEPVSSNQQQHSRTALVRVTGAGDETVNGWYPQIARSEYHGQDWPKHAKKRCYMKHDGYYIFYCQPNAPQWQLRTSKNKLLYRVVTGADSTASRDEGFAKYLSGAWPPEQGWEVYRRVTLDRGPAYTPAPTLRVVKH